MATIINIDSSLENATVSIAKDGIILKQLSNAVQKQHASFIHPAIQSLLKDMQTGIMDVDAIACTVGPGSYTGLRVGLAAAKGICYALNKPLITIGTLNAMAEAEFTKQKDSEAYYYCPMIDARRMEVYTALFNGKMQEIEPAHAVVIDEKFCSSLLQNHQIIFFGNGMNKFKQLVNFKNALFIEQEEIYTAINTLSHKMFENSDFTNLVMATPLYAKEFYIP